MKSSLAVVFLLATISVSAQSRSLFKSSSSIRADIEKVADDYYENFDNIKGDTIMETVSSVEFSSKIIPEGAIETTITKYKTPLTYSWQSTLFKTEEFKEAVAKYKQVYRQINGATLTFHDNAAYKLSGKYDAPDEARAFASSILDIGTYDHNLKSFKIEVALNYAFPEWIVKIFVYEKVADEDIRPSSGYTR
jgi:ABC-type antimicrobial peptide transport system permease subunit